MKNMENNKPKKKGRPRKVREDEVVEGQASQASDALGNLLAKVEELERKDKENQAKLKMLYEVADKNRVVNYESKATEKKSFKIKMSLFSDGIIVGWRTVRDELVKHPTTGTIVGENQEYELLILDNEGKIKKVNVIGYPAFSNARYNERVECEVVGRKESFEGKVAFDIRIPDGRVIEVPCQFVN